MSNENILCKGDKLICTNINGWYLNEPTEDLEGPAYNDVVTVRFCGVEWYEGKWEPIVWLEEFPGNHPDDAFLLEEFSFFKESIDAN